MKKKISELTYNEIENLCDTQNKCEDCPYKIGLITFDFNGLNRYAYGSKAKKKNETYCYCIMSLYDFIHKKVEVKEE